MKLLITGGAGFIGGHFVSYMINKYPFYHIVNLDKMTYAANRELAEKFEKHPTYRFVKGDIADPVIVDELFREGIDVVVHFAAESHVDRSIADPSIFVRTNVLGTNVLLQAATKYGVTKFVQISTDEVYGSLAKDDSPFSEESPLAPNSPYASSKAGADLLVRAYAKTYGLPVNITRCSNNYGPYQFPEKLIPLIIAHAYCNMSIPVYGDGLYIRDWLHVEDHCNAIDMVIHLGAVGEVYNIGGNNEKTNIEIVKQVLTEMKKPESLIRFVTDRPGHDRRYGIDATKLKSELGWKPVYSISSGLKTTIQWYLEHPDWWRGNIK